MRIPVGNIGFVELRRDPESPTEGQGLFMGQSTVDKVCKAGRALTFLVILGYIIFS